MINLLQHLNFSDEEIVEVENEFFGGHGTFNLEQRRVINCFSSENIQACPGSGKTTTLAAKLLLLKKRLHPGLNGGICILTHTNVAVDIIKGRLGSEASAFYSNYPNFLGTIQSFVNKFLAIPAYKQEFGSSIEAIDDEIFFTLIEKRHRTAPNALAYLSRNKGIEHLGWLSYNIHNFDISGNVTSDQPIVGKDSSSYGEISRIKSGLLKDGFLKYNEAYALAYRYLREYPQVVPLFSMRFPLVFLDEMQDTQDYQFNLLQMLFRPSSIFQTIGDVNQDIFGHFEAVAPNCPVSNGFSIATSNRFPQHIASIVEKVGVQQQALIATQAAAPITPHIIIFDDTTIASVKDKFGEIIIVNNLHLNTRSVFKAVGARKDAGQLSITDYFSDFNKRANKVREYYSTMDDYLLALRLSKDSNRNVKGLKDILFSFFLQVLKHSSIRDAENARYFTARSFERYLKNLDPEMYKSFRLQIEKSIKNFLDGLVIKNDLINFITNTLLPHFNVAATQALLTFFSAPANSHTNSHQTRHNIYQASYNGSNVDIIFDTIHGIKGETHTATLYLETFTNTYDVPKLLRLLNRTQNRTATYINNNRIRMKQGYVAMSRPTDLLCIAVHQSRIDLTIDWTQHGFTVVQC